MKIDRIEVDSFGALRDCSLSGLGDGLTVVLGPNESGKSTYSALVRQILYGYPDKRSKDHGYLPMTGGRAGRLVFADESGEWALGRYEGPKGGNVRIDALRGPERGQLLSEVQGHVTEQTFRVVFGFGLDELDDIASGSDQAVVARLYAGVTGLDVNPIDVRKALDDEAGRLFKPRGTTSGIGALLGEIKTQRSQVHELEAAARTYASDQARLAELDEELAPLKARRDELDRAARQFDHELQRVATLEQSLAEEAERIAQTRQRVEAKRREAAHVRFDERLLAVSAELTSVLEEASGAKQLRDRARSLESRAAELRRKAESLGVDAQDGPEARARLDAWRDRKAKLEAEVETARRNAETLSAKARSLAATGDVQAAATRNAASRRLLPLLAVGGGVAFAVAGWFLGQVLAAVLGGIVAVTAVVILLLGRSRTGTTLSDEAARAEADANAAEELRANAERRLAEETGAWATWLSEQRLDGRGQEPASVASVLDDARKRSELLEQADSAEAEARRDMTEADAWAARLLALAKGPLGISQESPEPGAIAIRAREALEAAKAGREARDLANAEADAAELELAQMTERHARLEEELAGAASSHGLESPAELRGYLETALESERASAIEAAERYEQLSTDRAQLFGRLNTQGRDATMARGRQRLEGLRQQAAELGDQYLVEALASRLVDAALQRYERDRQPEVVKTAARVFSAMTQGRYTDVRVPIGGDAVTVVTASGMQRATSELSRGTAEQLYLALRVGLIASVGEQGPHLPVLMDDIMVNYDAERMAAAGAAVAELAVGRQVIFFTCHERTAEALAGGVPGSVTVPLESCSP